MNNPVILKGNKSGIVLVLDDTADFNLILSELDKRLSFAERHYDKDIQLALTVESRRLSNPELDSVLQIFGRHGLAISDVIDKDRHKGCDFNIQEEKRADMFYIGNLRNGQVIHAVNSVMVLGSVSVGASIISSGSILVLGKLEGIARAGADGREDVFIAALHMNPEKLGIADILYTKDKMEGTRTGVYSFPAMAYAEDGNMFMRRI